jgi:pimeloyl-ACP methyl ester carboxylesterase
MGNRDVLDNQQRSSTPARQAGALVPGLQQAAGNRAMSSLMVQRDTATAAPGADLGSSLSRQVLEGLRLTATQTTFLAGAYAERGLNTVDALRSQLSGQSDTYKSAYGQYSPVIAAAGKEARNQQDWTNIIVGVAIGTGVGLLAAAILPELAGGLAVLAEVGGEVVEAGVAGGVQALKLTDVAGADLQPGGIDPNLLSSGIWQRLSELYRGVLNVQKHTTFLPLILGGTEYALGQFRLLDAGVEADMERGQLIEMATALGRAAEYLRRLNDELVPKLAALDALKTQVALAKPRSVREMEQDIWIMWMAEVSNSDSDILDLDAIEDHLAAIGVLGPSSLLGVDFGYWTSKDDEIEALQAARARAGTIREHYQSLSGS